MKTRLILLAAMVLGPAYAAAQTAATADREALVLTASLAGGYDDDVSSGTTATPSSDPRFRAGGSFAMTDVSLSYGRQRRNINFGAAGNASIRSYRAIETFTADSYAGSAGMSATIAPRLRIGANGSASRSSHFTLAILPVFAEDPVSAAEVPSLDYNLTAGELDRRHFGGQVRMSFGWGTNLTNDFDDCAPTANPGLTAISLVCKVTSANGRPAVKLSDNPAKATGDPDEIARYLKLFGGADRVRHAVKV